MTPWRRILKEAIQSWDPKRDPHRKLTHLTPEEWVHRQKDALDLFKRLGPLVKHLVTRQFPTVHLFLGLSKREQQQQQQQHQHKRGLETDSQYGPLLHARYLSPRLQTVLLSTASYEHNMSLTYSIKIFNGEDNTFHDNCRSTDDDDRFKDVPPEAIHPPKGTLLGDEIHPENHPLPYLHEQIRAFWQLILDHRSSLRWIELEHGSLECLQLPMLYFIPKNNNPTEDHKDDDKQRLQRLQQKQKIDAADWTPRCLIEHSPGAEFLARILPSLPRLQYFRPRFHPPRGFACLPILAQFGLASLQSLNLEKENFNHQAWDLFLQDDTPTSIRALFINPRIRTLRLASVDSSLLPFLVQEIFPSLEELILRYLADDVPLTKDRPHHPRHHYHYHHTNPERNMNRTLKKLTISGGECAVNLAMIPIRWMALEMLQGPIHAFLALERMLDKMPRIRDLLNVYLSPCEFGPDRYAHYRQSAPEDCLDLFSTPLQTQEQQQRTLQLPSWSTLRLFKIGYVAMRYGQESALYMLLPRMPNLTVLHLGCQVETALLRRVLNLNTLLLLEELIFEARDYCSKELARIVTTCERLLILVAQGCSMRAKDVIRKPWVCLRLERLQCNINGVPRLSEVQERILASGPPASPPRSLSTSSIFVELAKDGVKVEETAIKKPKEDKSLHYNNILRQQERSMTLQRQVYAQLAQLTKLRDVDLGDYHCYRHSHPLHKSNAAFYPGTLELSLQTGFDQLSTLQNLRVLGVHRVNYRLTAQEAEWMAQHWGRHFEILKGCRLSPAQAEARSTLRNIWLKDATMVEESLRPFFRQCMQLMPKLSLYK
ncbi:hypothetical protein BGZ83_009898 [Gryganskiella cystojenkinii]|nr:hypothetical protein BGZ83_009898 [Gryganskiella cystojenkinii]